MKTAIKTMTNTINNATVALTGPSYKVGPDRLPRLAFSQRQSILNPHRSVAFPLAALKRFS